MTEAERLTMETLDILARGNRVTHVNRDQIKIHELRGDCIDTVVIDRVCNWSNYMPSNAQQLWLLGTHV